MTSSGGLASTIDHIRKLLATRLSIQRQEHVAGVVRTAERLAHRFGVAGDRVALAAYAHDLDRELPLCRALAMAADWQVSLSRLERDMPVLIHGKVTAERLIRQFGVRDSDVVDAVRHHTLGSAAFGPVGLVLYVADFCEPGRRHLSASDRDRILRRRRLEEMVRDIIELSEHRFGPPAAPTRELRARITADLENKER